MERWFNPRSLLLCILLLAQYSASAQLLPKNFTVEGRLFQSDGVTPYTGNVDIMFDLLVAGDTCVIYREEHLNIDVDASDNTLDGVFSIKLGGGSIATSWAAVTNITPLFSSGTLINGRNAADSSACSVTPTSGAHREVQVRVQPTGVATYASRLTSYEVLGPSNLVITSVPGALVAETLQGMLPSQFIQVASPVTQANVTTLVDGSDASSLHHHDARYVPLSGSSGVTGTITSTSSLYLTSTTSSVGIGTTAASVADLEVWKTNPKIYMNSAGTGLGAITFAANGTQHAKIETISGADGMRFYSGSQVALEIDASKNLAVGGSLDVTGVVSLGQYTTAQENSTLLPALTPSAAGTTWYNTSTNQFRLWTGTTVLNTVGIAGLPSVAGEVVKWNGSAWVSGTDSGMTSLTGDVTGSASSGAANTVISAGAVTTAKLASDSVTAAKIDSAGAGTINRLVSSDSSTGTTLKFVGCALNEVMKFDASGRWSCATVASLLSQIAPTQISQHGATTAQVLKWNGFAWIPSADSDSGGDVTEIIAASPLTGGGLFGAVTVGINVGTGANQVVQLDGSARLPAVDGSQLTNILNGVAAGTAILVSGSTSTKTISVDVGVGASKIPQYSAGGLLAIGTTSATSGAALEVYGNSTTNSSILVPRATTGNRPGTAIDGMVRYNTSLAKFEAYENGGWYNMVNTAAGSGDFKADGSVAMTGQLRAADGTNGAPGISFSNDTNTGIYRSAADTMVLAAGGNPNLQIDGTSVRPIVDLLSNWTRGPYLRMGASPDYSSLAYSFTTDTDTGLWNGANDTLSLVTGGSERLRLSSSGDAQFTNFVSAAATGYGFNGNAGAAKGLFASGTDDISVVSGPNGSLSFGNYSSQSAFGYFDYNGLTVAGTGAVIVPRATAAQRPFGINGMIRYNTTSNKFEVYEGLWQNMLSTSGGGATSPAGSNSQIQFNNGGSFGASANLTWNNSAAWLDINGKYAQNGKVVLNTLAGTDNTFVGEDSGTAITSGIHNVAVGKSALASANTSDNIAIGEQTMQLHTTGGGNTAVGASNLKYINGWYNTAVGHNAGLNQSTGDYNVYLGRSAGYNQTAGDRNILIGAVDAPSLSGSYQLNIGNAIYGNLSTGQIGIGTNSPTSGAILDLNGTGTTNYSLIVPRSTTANRPSTGVNGMIRYNTTSLKFEVYEGLWQNMLSSAGGADNLGNHTATQALVATTGTAATPSYTFSGDLDTGISNLGTNRIAFSTGGTQRVKIDEYGRLDLKGPLMQNGVVVLNTLVGTQNTFIGQGAGANYTTGDANVAIGLNTLNSGTTNTGNLAIGVNNLRFVTGDSNTALGIGALQTVVGGNANAAVGNGAGLVLSSGNYNTLLGTYAGSGQTSGDYNILIGYSAQAPSITGSGQLNIGDTIYGDLNKKFIGIGTTTATAELDVAGTGGILVPRGTTTARAASGINGMIRYNTTSLKFEVYEGVWQNMLSSNGGGADNLGNHTATTAILATPGTGSAPSYSFNGDTDTGMWLVGTNRVALTTGGTERMRWDALGNVGIGTTNPTLGRVQINAPNAGSTALAVRAAASPTADPFAVFDSSGTSQAGVDNVFNIWTAADVHGANFKSGSGSSSATAYGPNLTGSTGMYFSGNDILFADAGTDRFTIKSGGRVGIGSTTPKAELEVAGTGGILVPRGTTVQRAFGINGMIRYNSTSMKFEVYEGLWQNMLSAGGSSGATDLDGLSDAIFDSADTSLYIGTTVGNTSGNGDFNFGFGNNVLDSLTTGTSNIGIGYYAMKNMTSGTQNIAIGKSALQDATNSSNNVAIGENSLIFSTGSDNIAVGNATLTSAANTNGNVALGHSALQYNTGNNNIGVGTRAGDNVTSGGQNIIIGYDVDAPSATGSYQLNIGNIIFGTGVSGTGSTIAGKIGIGSNAPSAELEVAGTGGILVPRAASTARPFGINGMIRYNTTSLKFEVYEGTWQNMLLAGDNLGNHTASQAIVAITGTASAPAYTFSGQNNRGLYAAGTGGVALSTSSLERLRIGADGHIGIGTVTPAELMHLYRTQNAQTSVLVQNPNNGNASEALFEAASDSGSVMLGIGSSTFSQTELSNRGYLKTSSAASGLTIWNDGTGDIRFYTGNTPNERIRIQNNGNVGVGTTSAGYTLDVAGSGSFTGEVKVRRLAGITGTYSSGSGVSTYTTGGGASVTTISGNDAAFAITLNSGTPSAAGLIQVRFAVPYAAIPICVFSPGNANAATEIAKIYITSSTTDFTIFAQSALSNASSAYIYNVHCIQR